MPQPPVAPNDCRICAEPDGHCAICGGSLLDGAVYYDARTGEAMHPDCAEDEAAVPQPPIHGEE